MAEEQELSLLDKLLDEDNDEIIELAADGGEKVKFQQIAVVMYEGKPYAILHPMDMAEDQVVVFRLDEYDEEMLELVYDEVLASNVLRVFQDEEK